MAERVPEADLNRAKELALEARVAKAVRTALNKSLPAMLAAALNPTQLTGDEERRYASLVDQIHHGNLKEEGILEYLPLEVRKNHEKYKGQLRDAANPDLEALYNRLLEALKRGGTTPPADSKPAKDDKPADLGDLADEAAAAIYGAEKKGFPYKPPPAPVP
ncbi:hypothetical protein HY642_04030, partial [Candidatus Woesearchaeota archaeon]|nr:hypothetical protein [Candidatus Woesearchaeota archaeon]